MGVFCVDKTCFLRPGHIYKTLTVLALICHIETYPRITNDNRKKTHPLIALALQAVHKILRRFGILYNIMV